MKSFPSSFTKNKAVNNGLASGNLKQTLKNTAGAIMDNVLSGKDTLKEKQELGERLDWREYNYNDSVKMINYTNNTELKDGKTTLTQRNNAVVYENANKIPAVDLAAINKYRLVYKMSAIQYGPTSKSQKEDQKGKEFYFASQEGVSPSLFNPWFGVRLKGFTLNSPLMYLNSDSPTSVEVEFSDGDVDKTETLGHKMNIQLDNMNGDFTDCSIKTLVELGKKYKSTDKQYIGPGGFYRYADFMYCKELGKISNNHLITLRRFSHPIGDNIFKSGEDELIPDKGRLVTWFGTEDNKLEEICKFNYNTTWKEMNSESKDIESKEDDPKLLPSIINIANPKFNNYNLQTGAAGANMFYGWVETAMPKFFQASASNGASNESARYQRDASKIWTPKNTIQSTHLYEGKIQFNQSFKLTFNYELRSYDGINPKSAFLDLLGNILEITHNRGKFWGGERRWLGAPRNNQGWKRANQLFDKLDKGLTNGLDALLGCNSFEDIGSLVSGSFKGVMNIVSEAAQAAQDLANDPEKIKNIGKNVGNQGKNILLGMLKNKLGRPAIYAVDSLLTGNNVGLWHVTIGNPRNPIMSMGNLILENSELTQYGPLGIDDFPTGLKLEVTLKHARPRDLTEIASMYTCGQGGLLLNLNDRDWKKYFNVKDAAAMYDIGFGGHNTDTIISNDNNGENIPDSNMMSTVYNNYA